MAPITPWLKMQAYYDPLKITGKIVAAQGVSIKATLPLASVEDLCFVETRSGKRIPAQVISFDGNLFSLAPFGDPVGIFPGSKVWASGHALTIPLGNTMVGRALNSRGEPIDGQPPFHSTSLRPVTSEPSPAIGRPLVSEILATGIRAVDGFCTLGKGQRLGIFASAGLGKSTLLGSLARYATVDVVVVALVGERRREVQEFIEHTLGPEGLARSVLIIATSDESSLQRQLAPTAAATIAEFFRDQGKDVLLIVDSLTRWARAVRETTLAAGELPVRHGYTNSVYTLLPKLVERAGRASSGSITALYTILTNHEDDIDPLSDEIKSLLDGHICLRQELAELGIFPAIDISRSVSRLFHRLHDSAHNNSAHTIRRAMARYLNERQMILLGGAVDNELQAIIAHEKPLWDLVRQPHTENVTLTESLRQIHSCAMSLQSATR